MTILVCQEENLASDWLTQRCDGGPGHHRTGRYGGPGHNRAPRCQLILQHWLTENSIWPTFCLATLPTSSRRIVDHDHNSWVSSPGRLHVLHALRPHRIDDRHVAPPTRCTARTTCCCCSSQSLLGRPAPPLSCARCYNNNMMRYIVRQLPTCIRTLNNNWYFNYSIKRSCLQWLTFLETILCTLLLC